MASTSLLEATAGTRFSVIGGPGSNQGYYWWQVRTKIGSISYEGWIAETSPPSAPGKFLHPTPISQSTQVVVYGNLNLRSSASAAATAIATMPGGTILNIVGGPEQNEGYTWWQVSGPSGIGWAAEAVYVNPASSAGPAVGQGRVTAGWENRSTLATWLAMFPTTAVPPHRIFTSTTTHQTMTCSALLMRYP